MLDQVAKALWEAQQRAAALFGEVVSSELIEPGILESELSKRIHDLAANKYGCRRHWHKRIVRAGPNTLLTYYDESEDRRIGDDDIVYVDLGPVFEAWEADYGRTFVVGADPVKHALNRDLGVAFAQGKEFFRSNRDLTAGALYDFIAGRAQQLGWTFGAPTAVIWLGTSRTSGTPPMQRGFPFAVAILSPCESLTTKDGSVIGFWKCTSLIKNVRLEDFSRSS